MNFRGAATGANFSQGKEREEPDTGCILTTSDNGMRKIDPVPLGCGEVCRYFCCRLCMGELPHAVDSASSGTIFARNATTP